MNRFIVIIVIAISVAFSGVAYAGSETTTLDISVTKIPTCTCSATGINFPDFDGAPGEEGVGFPSPGDVTVTCPDTVPYNIALDAGLNYNAGEVDGWRYVSDGTNYIGYALHQDNAPHPSETPWGDSDYDATYPGGASLADTGNGTPQAHPVYGGISTSDAPPGTYIDTVTVTVYY